MTHTKIELDSNLLLKFFIKDVTFFADQIDKELEGFGFESEVQKQWVTQLIFNYALMPIVATSEDKATLDSELEKLEQSVSKLIVDKYKSNNQFNLDSIKSKNSNRLFFLGMARIILGISLMTLNEGNYQEGLSLMNTARYAFTLFQESEYKEKEKSLLARANAFKRHIETYSLKNQAIDYWCKNIDFKLSNEKAAEILSKIVPVSHRKLSQYVAEAKRKNIHPASKV